MTPTRETTQGNHQNRKGYKHQVSGEWGGNTGTQQSEEQPSPCEVEFELRLKGRAGFREKNGRDRKEKRTLSQEPRQAAAGGDDMSAAHSPRTQRGGQCVAGAVVLGESMRPKWVTGMGRRTSTMQTRLRTNGLVVTRRTTEKGERAEMWRRGQELVPVHGTETQKWTVLYSSLNDSESL